jgi:GT2 family glycosyltransferase
MMDLLSDLRKSSLPSAYVLIVDNGSTDGTIELLRGVDDITLVSRPDNPGYAAAINASYDIFKQCDKIFILNPDTRLEEDSLALLAAAVDEAPTVGAAAPKIVGDDGQLYRSIRREPSLSRVLGDAIFGSRFATRGSWWSETELRADRYTETQDVDWVTGAALCVRRSAIEVVGAWDERFFLYSEETDWLRRLRESGWRVRFVPSSTVWHEGGGSGTSALLDTLLSVNKVRYAKKHRGRSYAAAMWILHGLGLAVRVHTEARRARLVGFLKVRSWATLPDRIRGREAVRRAEFGR